MNRFQRRYAASKTGSSKLAKRKTEFSSKLADEIDKRKVRLPLYAREAHAQVDALVQDKREKENPPITCTKGCSACCKQLVLVSYAEASRIVVERPDAVEAAASALLDAEKTYENLRVESFKDGARHTREPSTIDPFQDPEALDAVSGEWWRLQKDCPFLGEDKLCTIYEQRPAACRSLYVITDPSVCAIPEPDAEVLGWRPEEFGEPVAKMWNREAVEAKTGNVLLGPLPALVLHVHSAMAELKRLGDLK